MRRLFLELCSLLLVTEITGKLDFSQFHLPPCCYIGQDQFSGYASTISEKVNSTFKREITSSELTPENKTTESAKLFKLKERIYSLTVPVSRILNETDTNAKTELEDINSKMLHILGRREATNTARRENQEVVRPKESEGRFGEYWESKKIPNESPQGTAEELQITATEGFRNQQTPKKIPSSWVKYLKRALYQSVTDGQGLINVEQPISISRNNEQQIRKAKIRYPETWRSIKSAELQYVNKMSQVSSNPYSAIYLPTERGPIVSGVLLNSNDGGLLLRAASELHVSDVVEGIEHNCRCHLMNPGEILIAYWSVSRIFKDDGQPALQYLVYPLPYIVPTPPEFVQFTNNEMFLPSPIDPLTNLYENMNQNGNYLDESAQQPFNSDGTSVHIPKFEQVNRNPEYSLETYHTLEQPNLPNVGILPFPQGPTGPTGLLPPSPDPQGPQSQLGIGLIFENGRQLPPELIQQYQTAVQNYFNHHQNDKNLLYHTIPYNDLNINDVIRHDFPTPAGLIGSAPLLPPVREQEVPAELGNTNSIPNDLPQITASRPPAFPNSIQDIIAPIPLPLQGNLGSLTPPHQNVHHGPLAEQFHLNCPINAHPYADFNGNNQGRVDLNVLKTDRSQNQKGNKEHQTKYSSTVGGSLNNKHNYEKERDERPEIQSPLMIPNILDNEKKYYPMRLPYKRNMFGLEKVQKLRFQRPKFLQDINDKGGYILDF